MTTTRGRRPPQGEPVLDRAFALLRAFTAERPELTLTELTRRSGLPMSTARRMAARLTQLGALERSPDGRYAVGMQLWEIASLAPRGHGLRQVALPYMEDLYEVTHQHVLLAVLDGDDAVLVERISAHEAVDILYRVGGRMPLTDTGVGLVLLATSDPDEQNRLLDRTTAPAQRSTLRATLAAIRRDDIAIFRPGGDWRVVSVAAPVRDHSGSVTGALSIVVPDGTVNPRLLTTAVRAAARGISRQLRPLRR
ncbi:MAG TPA: IclR family transcriptional regulator [Pseudonocardia sp.]|nr:IclR family transcriptional regulator [Pseudonocardia sp.]